MSNYLGDFTAGSIVYGAFNTRDTDGAPIVLAGSPVLRVYKDDGGGEDDSGITLNVDFDSRVGLNLFKIDTSSDGTFYAAGHHFTVVVTVGTVDGISVVGSVVGSFSIENRNGGGASLVDIEGLLDETLADSIPSVGTRPSLRQALYMVTQFLLERGVSGTTVTVRKADGTTPLFTLELDSSTAPTDSTRDT